MSKQTLIKSKKVTEIVILIDEDKRTKNVDYILNDCHAGLMTEGVDIDWTEKSVIIDE